MPEEKERKAGTRFPDLPPLPDPTKPIKNLTEAVAGLRQTGERVSEGLLGLRRAGEEFMEFLRRKPWERRP